MQSTSQSKTLCFNNKISGAGKWRRIGPDLATLQSALGLIALSIFFVKPVFAEVLPSAANAVPSSSKSADPRNPSVGAVVGQLTNATLTGIIHARLHPMALIETDGKQHIYTTGDSLSSGARIAEIAVDRVILALGDKRTTLYLGGMSATKTADAKEMTTHSNIVSTGARDAQRSLSTTPEKTQIASARARPPDGAISPSWVIPEWLQRGRSGPVSMEEVKRSPWSQK